MTARGDGGEYQREYDPSEEMGMPPILTEVPCSCPPCVWAMQCDVFGAMAVSGALWLPPTPTPAGPWPHGPLTLSLPAFSPFPPSPPSRGCPLLLDPLAFF